MNHESPKRGDNFVTQKIIKAAVRIKNGLQDKLELGNLSASRDWSHAEDMVYGMYLMLQQFTPDDFVLASGETHTIQYFVETVFAKLGLDWQKYVVTTPSNLRPEDVTYLRGDCSKAKHILGWTPMFDLDFLIDDMIISAESQIKVLT
jgi:GDPmannose 4,6-dehydratase